MPTFRAVQSQLAPSAPRGAQPRQITPLDVSPILQGISAIDQANRRAAHEAEIQRKEQERLLARQQEDEARIAVSNATSARLASLTEQLTAAQNDPQGMAGATERILKNHDEWAKGVEKTLNEPGRQMFAIQSNNIRLKTHESFFGAEVKARQVGLVSDFSQGLDNDSRVVWSDPGQYTDALARRLAVINTLDVPPEVRRQLTEKTRDSLTMNAALGMVRTNPRSVLADLGYTERTGIGGAPEWTPPKTEPGTKVMGVNSTVLTDLVMQAESGGKRYGPDGRTLLASAKGARGEMQVLDSTNTDPGFGVTPARDGSPEERARVGRDYLTAMLSRYGGNVPMALAAYNAGPGRVDAAVQGGGDWLARMPDETKAYVSKITKQYIERQNLKPGSVEAADMTAGGAVTSPVESSGYGPVAVTFDVSRHPLYGNLPPEKLDTIANHALTIVRQQTAAEQAALRAQQQAGAAQARGIISALDNGYAQDAGLINSTKALIVGTPAYAELVNAETRFQVLNQFRALSPSQQAAQLEAYRPQAVTPQSAVLHEKLTKVSEDARAQLKADGFSYGANVLGLKPASVDMSSIDAMVPGLATRFRQAQQISAWAESPINPLTAAEGDQVAKILAALGPEQRSQAAAKLYGAVGPAAVPLLVQQIDKTDKVLALGMAAGADMTDRGRRTSQLIFMGQQALKDKSIKEDSAAMTGLRASIAAEVGDVLQGTARDNVIEAARYIALGSQAEGSSMSAKGAVRLALGGDIVTHNGKRIPVPMGVTDDNVRERVEWAAQTLDSQLPGGFAVVGGMQIPTLQFMASVPDAILEPAGMGSYFIRAGGSLARNSRGQNIVLKVSGVAP